MVFGSCLQLLLEAPDDIFSFKFNPSEPTIIAGGCVNGQVGRRRVDLHFTTYCIVMHIIVFFTIAPCALPKIFAIEMFTGLGDLVGD